MKSSALLGILVTFAAAPAFAQGYGYDDEGSGNEVVDQPTSPAPNQAPPPPPPQSQQQGFQGQPPPPVVVQPSPVAPAGQWAFTAQYGWIWMPYAQGYTWVPGEGAPQMYVYYPAYGWRWVVAPWVYGWGPRPYWGVWGVSRFAWYSRPWFRPMPYRYYTGPRYHYGPAPYRHGGGYHYAAPQPHGNYRYAAPRGEHYRGHHH